jgi:hypothetical protein
VCTEQAHVIAGDTWPIALSREFIGKDNYRVLVLD